MIDSSPPFETFEYRFEPTHQAASETRNRLRRQLESNRIDGVIAADVELTAAELLSNAVDQRPGAPVELLVTLLDSRILVTVTNRHSTEERLHLPEPSDDDDPLKERGRGLDIVEALADGMWVNGDQTSTSVSCLHTRLSSPV